jgi:glycerol-3-phosphate dehydrogenase
VSFSRSQQQAAAADPKGGGSKKPLSASGVVRDAGLNCTSVVSDPQEVPGPEGIPSRRKQVQLLQSGAVTEYDVLIIGGGATGAGCALDAAARGLTVACVERGDFASETSSRSTKLIWAGIRYMATATAALLTPALLTQPVATVQNFWGEMTMVLHCHNERRYMIEKQQHLCHWIPIAVPFTSWHVSPAPMGHWLFGFFPVLAPIVFKMYDALSAFSCPPSYIMTPSSAKTAFPTLSSENLKYCAVFYEAQHNDSRTNLAIAMTAAAKGAHIANYVEITHLMSGNDNDDNGDSKIVTGARAMDRMTGQTFEIRAKKVILAGGPFTDDLRDMETTKDGSGSKPLPAVRGASGTHIVLPGYFVPANMGLLDYNTSDGRFLFILPWLGHTLVGTTDKKCVAGTLQNPPEDEIEWLLQESKKYLRSDLEVRRSDVLSAWRGWRPLAADPHAPPGAPVSRDHVISENPDTGVLFIAGGKWTTWREMAQEVVDRVARDQHQPCTTLNIKLHGATNYQTNMAIPLIQKYGLAQDVAEHLVATYGGGAWDVCHLIPTSPSPSSPATATATSSQSSAPSFGKRLVEGFPYLEAEVVYATREYACTIEDVLSRRTRLAYLNKAAAMEAIPRVAEIMARELGWTPKVKEQQMQAAAMYVDTYAGRIPAAPQ